MTLRDQNVNDDFHSAKLSAYAKELLNSRNESKRKVYTEKERFKRKARYEALSPESKAQIKTNWKARQDALSPEMKVQINENRRKKGRPD